MTSKRTKQFACNGAKPGNGRWEIVDYRAGHSPKINLSLPDFLRRAAPLPDRVLDLLEIAGYAFSADRLVSRGARRAVEFQSWSRSLRLAVRVRDVAFWQRQDVSEALSAALSWMTGDRSWEFAFEPGHTTPPAGLFDKPAFDRPPAKPTHVCLFSGGLDSLAGAVDLLETVQGSVCLVSHRSGYLARRAQDTLAEALGKAYPGRIVPYKFECTLTAFRAPDENQRTRAFLFSCIAYALAKAFHRDEFYMHENGVTSVNLPRRQESLNARVSRTTHPKTLRLLEGLLSAVHESPFSIRSPFLWKTKAEVFSVLRSYRQACLAPSSCSCSTTFKPSGNASHCGGCYQCIDRRFAAYAANADTADDGLYAKDFIAEAIEAPEVKTVLLDYVRLAKDVADVNVDRFVSDWASELSDLVGSIPGPTREEVVRAVQDLFARWGTQVGTAISRMRSVHDHPYRQIPRGSFLALVAGKDYLRDPAARMAEEVADRLGAALPLAFQTNRPNDERDLNDKVQGFLGGWRQEFDREFPMVRFSTSVAVPDHSWKGQELFVECKYLRGATTPSKATAGMAEDLTKYSCASHVLFVVYDPDRAIADDGRFCTDFEKRRPCSVRVIR